jgi:hypothetical protein
MLLSFVGEKGFERGAVVGRERAVMFSWHVDENLMFPLKRGIVLFL